MRTTIHNITKVTSQVIECSGDETGIGAFRTIDILVTDEKGNRHTFEFFFSSEASLVIEQLEAHKVSR